MHLALILICALLLGCLEPVPTDFQSARTLGKLNLEINGYANAQLDKPEHSQVNAGGQVGFGIHKRIDLYAGYSLLYSPPITQVGIDEDGNGTFESDIRLDVPYQILAHCNFWPKNFTTQKPPGILFSDSGLH